MQVESDLRKPSTSEAAESAAGGEPNEPVTVLVTRQPKPGRKAELEAIIEDFRHAVGKAAGFLGMDVVRPTEPGAKEFHIVLLFDRQSNLQLWKNSPQSGQFMARADAVTEPKSKRVERVNGLEAWFVLPDRAGTAPPPKWKTAIMSAMAIYPLNLFLPDLVRPAIGQLPKLLGTLLIVVAMSGLMTWVVMPLMTLIFKSWLYPADEKGERAF